MYVVRILYPVEVLGPGKRIGIWFCGCPHHCKGCSNPELWDFNERYKTTVETVLSVVQDIASKNQVDGFTISGGDPFYQREELLRLLSQIKSIGNDILVYTGYEKRELSEDDLKDIAVLIDGKYIEELNTNCVLRGSENQKIYVLKNEFESKYDNYIKNTANAIQNFTTADGIVSVGIHKANFKF